MSPPHSAEDVFIEPPTGSCLHHARYTRPRQGLRQSGAPRLCARGRVNGMGMVARARDAMRVEICFRAA